MVVADCIPIIHCYSSVVFIVLGGASKPHNCAPVLLLSCYACLPCVAHKSLYFDCTNFYFYLYSSWYRCAILYAMWTINVLMLWFCDMSLNYLHSTLLQDTICDHIYWSIWNSFEDKRGLQITTSNHPSNLLLLTNLYFWTFKAHDWFYLNLYLVWPCYLYSVVLSEDIPQIEKLLRNILCTARPAAKCFWDSRCVCVYFSVFDVFI